MRAVGENLFCTMTGPSKGVVVSVGKLVTLEVFIGDTVLVAGLDKDNNRKPGNIYAFHQDEIIGVEEEEDDLPPLETTAERLAIYQEIDNERDYQDEKWGGAVQDDSETEGNWEDYVVEYVKGSGRANYEFRKRMLKVAALAVAAIESHDRKQAS